MANQSAEKKSRRWHTPVATALGAVVLAYITGIAPWTADHVTGLFASAKHVAPVSYSVSQLVDEPCESGGAFVPEPTAHSVLRKGPPANWSDLYKFHGAAFVGNAGTEVSIQGESRRTVTLTGIHFNMKELGKRPAGIAFRGQCGGGAAGHYIQADLDSTPPKIIQSESFLPGRIRPIQFPWTVSLTDPLLLYVSATTQKCFCEWYAEIPWVSGAKRGTIMIGNPDEGIRLASDHGLPSYVPGEESWEEINW